MMDGSCFWLTIRWMIKGNDVKDEAELKILFGHPDFIWGDNQ